jgi:hypothetical protein
MRIAITFVLILAVGSATGCTQGPRPIYEPVLTRAKPLVFLGTVQGLHYEPAYQGKQLVVDVAVHEMAFGDSVQVVHLAPSKQLVPETNEIQEVSHGEGRVFFAPGDRVIVAAERHPSADLYRINFVRFLEAPFEEREQYPLHQTDLSWAPDSLLADPALSIGERYALFPRKFEVDLVPLEERLDDLVSFYKESWWRFKYRWADTDRAWRPLPRAHPD